MICVSIQNKTLDEIFGILDRKDVEMAEIRLDRCDLTSEEIETLFSTSDKPLVATCRFSEILEKQLLSLSSHPHITDSERKKAETKAAQTVESRLMWAIDAGSAFADIEIEAPAMMSKRLRRKAVECGTTLIRSYHNYETTDSLESLKAVTEKCLHLGAEIVKIAVTANSEKDVARIAELYAACPGISLIAFCMGEAGHDTRLDCLRQGAPFTYAALDGGDCTASGQWPYKEMMAALYGHPVETGNVSVSDEPILMPASKSFAQRAIIAAALAQGVSVLRGYSPCGDTDSAIAVARALGATVSVGLSYEDNEVDKQGSVLRIEGIGASPDCLSMDRLHVGESGLLARLLIPLMSVLNNGSTHIEGEKTLVNRPLQGAGEIMGTLGVSVTPDTPSDGTKVPLTVSGHPKTGKVEISGKGGSQLISGLLMALPMLSDKTEIFVKDPKSIPYLYITLDVLKRFGVKVMSEMEGDEEFMETRDWQYCTGITFKFRGGQKYIATDMDIEGDWSAAANFMVAGAVFGSVDVDGLDTGSLQADLSIMDILVEAGASISQLGEDDPKGIVRVTKAPLKAFEIDAGNCPDLFPIVSVLAAFCQGTSRITGVGRLSSKESDRATAITSMLTSMGVPCSIKGDTLIIEGHALSQRLLRGKLLKGGRYTSHHDHRMAMALQVAALGADSLVIIDDMDCVSKSFPGFFEAFSKTETFHLR